MGSRRHLIRTVAVSVAVLAMSGCGLSFSLDPMNGQADAPTPTPEPTRAVVVEDRPYDREDPTTWTDRQLVAQTIFECAPVSNIREENRAVRNGIGGVVFLGGEAPSDLKRQIRALVNQAGDGVAPFISSDEEGGAVQRLAGAIYPLPSAEVMGTWTPKKLAETAETYGAAMKRLGVDMAFSPVADLDVAGHFIGNQSRAFSATPNGAATSAIAWARGLDAAGVVPVIKHWPGHGSASDTHSGPGRIPPLSALLERDLVPFDRAIDAGFTAVMVGHLESKGLTERGTPASRSPKALSMLREQIGPDGLIVTDSLTMEAALVGVGHRPGDVVYESLRAGVDVALVCSGPPNIIDRVAPRVSDEGLSRAMLVEKVTRILNWKRRYGVIE